MQPKKKRSSFIVDFLIGGTSAAVSKTIVAPKERAKQTIFYEKGLSIFNTYRRIVNEEKVTA